MRLHIEQEDSSFIIPRVAPLDNNNKRRYTKKYKKAKKNYVPKMTSIHGNFAARGTRYQNILNIVYVIKYYLHVIYILLNNFYNISSYLKYFILKSHKSYRMPRDNDKRRYTFKILKSR